MAHYILDFYCQEASLVVELDGGQHNIEEGAAKDARRTAALAELGIAVIRVWNHEFLKNTEAVLEKIYLELVKRVKRR